MHPEDRPVDGNTSPEFGFVSRAEFNEAADRADARSDDGYLRADDLDGYSR